MDKQRKLILAFVGLVLVFAAAFGLSFTGRDKEPPASNKVELASLAERDQEACASSATYSRLKQALFDDAIKVSSNAENLETLATHSVVRMENPVVKGRDPSSNAITCSGTFVLELPPGAERAFGGQRRLTAEVDYAAQPAADGSGMVYQINGAERIIAGLANFDMQGRQFAPSTQPEVQMAEADMLPPPYSGPAMGGPFEPADEDNSAVAAAPAPRAPIDTEQAQRRERAVAQQRERQTEGRQRTLAERSAEARQEAEQRRLAEARTERAQKARAERQERQARARALARAEGQRIRPRPGARPSFNCRNARTRSERMVCSNGSLAARDRQMSSQFYSALADADPRTRRELQRTRNRFLAYRERCRTEECVADAYEGRMAEIDDIMTGR